MRFFPSGMSHAYRIVLIDINLVPARKNVSCGSAKVTPYNSVTDIVEFAWCPWTSIAADKAENQLLVKKISIGLLTNVLVNMERVSIMSIVKQTLYVRIGAF